MPIRVIALSNPRLAQAFVDYMRTQQIHLEMRPQGHEAELWLDDETQLRNVQEALEIFLRDPTNPRYLAASWQTGSMDTGIQYQRYSFLQTLKQKAGPLTLSVMVVTIAVFILMQISGYESVMAWLAFPAEGQQAQLWRWFSHALLHFSLLHILFNLMWWWYLGGPVEKVLGTGKLLVITLVSALVSGWAQSWFSGTSFGGLSGVVYALMGYVWLRGEREPDGYLAMPRSLMAFALLWLVAGYFDILGMSIANAAHVAGLIVGLLMAFWDTYNKTNPR
ncbi:MULTISPECIES: rhomboid family intramembrane serine protease GlpG [Pectobacterium]|uniref:Rhomboid protease GlpG n=1 Tax=Pectobacterium punjabense TaxID=2108399 RepID=A0ABX6L6T7_9GAMM|nr:MULTISPECIES: rhomboid family intramembrane serine protease GlpG [Pectobacterium]GKW11462.1 rhomboid protease GlpG [Pectobacterium carotovorum subsp. carotovorum]MBS4431317.1 rhomboid family intramembrane serine protease GlpG [Pectobacterium punjabense]MBT9182947.1 rhomboid family intramembrane serine protease GlpG [Pectobacterium punjabense]MCE9731023.1 rhomboid family intramembrane serine protease GlpG [Pectobacterium sp. IFB5596]MDG0798982.1 rhomboid family intramembrane serine protease 